MSWLYWINQLQYISNGCHGNQGILMTLSYRFGCHRSSELRPIKRVIDHKRRTCRNNNRLHTQPFWTPLKITLYDIFKSNHWWTDGQTDGRTDGRYQTYYLPSFVVDNNPCRHEMLESQSGQETKQANKALKFSLVPKGLRHLLFSANWPLLYVSSGDYCVSVRFIWHLIDSSSWAHTCDSFG